MRSGSAFHISGIPALSRDRIPNFPGVDSHIFHTLCHAAPDLAVVFYELFSWIFKSKADIPAPVCLPLVR